MSCSSSTTAPGPPWRAHRGSTSSGRIGSPPPTTPAMPAPGERSTNGCCSSTRTFVPPATLLDDFFSEPIPMRCGIVAGEVDGAPGQPALTARHTRSRNHLGVEANLLDHGPHPAAGTANLMLRRDLWRRLDGFAEVRSGADLELCWRAQDAGRGFVLHREARVEHLYPERLGPTLRKARRYGAGQAWLEPPLCGERAALAGSSPGRSRACRDYRLDSLPPLREGCLQGPRRRLGTCLRPRLLPRRQSGPPLEPWEITCYKTT